MNEWIDSSELLASWFVDSEEAESDEIDASSFIEPPEPTHHKPGTAGKVAVLRKRLEMGQLFWHTNDEQDLIKAPGFLKFVAPAAFPPPPVAPPRFVFDWLAAAAEIKARAGQEAKAVVIADDITILGTIYKDSGPYYQDSMFLSGSGEYGVQFSGGDIVVCSKPLDGCSYTGTTFWPLSAILALR